MEIIPKSIEAFFEWFGELDVEYHVVVISALTTLVVMILGHKLRPWIGCKLGIHNWQFIDLQRQEIDFQSYGRVCWDDCLIQVWTSSGFVDRVETYAVRRRASPPSQDPIIFVGDVIGTMDYMLSGPIPYIVKGINADVVMRILEDATVNGYSYDDVFRNEYAVFPRRFGRIVQMSDISETTILRTETFGPQTKTFSPKLG